MAFGFLRDQKKEGILLKRQALFFFQIIAYKYKLNK